MNKIAHIQNVRVLDPYEMTDTITDIFIDGDGCIQTNCSPTNPSTSTIDGRALWLFPPAIDLCVNLRGHNPQRVTHELRAAAQSGVGHIVAPPDQQLCLDTTESIDTLQNLAKSSSKSALLLPLGALTKGLAGQSLTDMAALTSIGAIGLSQGKVSIANTRVLMQAMQYAATFSQTVWLRPTDWYLSQGGVAAHTAQALLMGLPTIVDSAETIAIQTIIELVKLTQCRVHLTHISTINGVTLIDHAKKQGLPITADVSLHHLILNEEQLHDYDTLCRFDPPIRPAIDQEALWQGVATGILDAVCSDHTVVSMDEKLLPFELAVPGASALDLLIPLLLSEGQKRQIPIITLLKAITANPHHICQLPDQPPLSSNKATQFVLFDPTISWSPTRNSLHSACPHTPLLDWSVRGRIIGHYRNRDWLYWFHEHTDGGS